MSNDGQQGNIIGERFEVGEMIGSGGMATVYLGVDRETGQSVAIKLLKADIIALDPGIVARFEREGDALRRLDHPSIVKILATVREDNKTYVVMEYVGGGDLRGLLDDHRRRSEMIPVERVVEIALDIADALSRAHRLKIYHRDIKPDNILMAEDGTPRLTDFGVAHIGDAPRMTQTGAIIGTLGYLSPEGCTGDTLDHRADIWSFGVVLYEMLTLRLPFSSPNTAALLTAIIAKDPEPLAEIRPDTPPALVDLVEMMMVKDPDQRMSSTRMVGATLEAILHGETPPEHTPTETGEKLAEIRDALRESQTIVESTPPMDGRTEITPPPTASLPQTNIPAAMPTTESAAPIPKQQMKRLVLMGVGIGVIATFVIIFLLASSSGTPTPGQAIATQRASDDINLDPVPAGETMVIVANLEPLPDTERADPTRFIVEDLQDRLERDVPFSEIHIRPLNQVITTAERAAEVAAANDAPLVIWGDYDDDSSTVNIQLGVLPDEDSLAIERQFIVNVVDADFTLTDERNQSIAPYLVVANNIIAFANDDIWGIAEGFLVLAEVDELDMPDANGIGIASRWYNSGRLFITDSELALAGTTAAIELDPRNPLLYGARNSTYQRLGRIEESNDDVQTASALTDGEWAFPYYMLAQNAILFEDDPITSQENYARAVELNPDDWYGWTFLGAVQYMNDDFEAAQESINRALSLSPEANFAHIFATILAMRRGEMLEMQRLFEEVLVQFPDPSVGPRILDTIYGRQAALTTAASAFGSFTLRQWNTVIDQVAAARALDNDYIENYLPDVLLLEGFAHCNLQDIEAAIASYTELIDLVPDYAVVYGLRGQLYVEQELPAPAAADFAQILQIPGAARQLLPLARQFQNGEITCENFLDYDFEALLTSDE